jgi:PAS domain S-box-containing protein
MSADTKSSSPTPEQDAQAEVQQELLRSQSRIAALLAIAADSIISLDERFCITLFNEGAEIMFGYDASEVLGHPIDMLIPVRFRDRHAHDVRGFAGSSVAARRMGERQEIYALRKDGSEFPAEASIAKLDAGDERIYLAVVRDVTERKQAEALLARSNAELEERVMQRTTALQEEIRRREETQAALIQAQRMEAFGQLTGGIAHDFNNLLTIVSGNLELLSAEITAEDQLDLLGRAADAAQMGARLTSRLLTFSRRRRLEPVIVNLNDLVLGIAELLKRSLGEQVGLTTMLAGALWPSRVDPSEVENAVLNLAINARDAMPKGGKLVIETRNVSVGEAPRDGEPTLPGDYVMISVSDTGLGMSEETKHRALEPFFTTKGGHGTGLGLSTVYGFAQQSGGHVSIQSQVGEGTTISLYLPRAQGERRPVSEAKSPPVPLSENCETVLVVEDNPEVRELTLQRVEGLGYVTQEASNVAIAQRLLETSLDIQLVFSDVILGDGMTGVDLARWVRANFPHIPVLLTTGYAGEAESEEGEFAILRKPYTRLELAVALQKALTGARV